MIKLCYNNNNSNNKLATEIIFIKNQKGFLNNHLTETNYKLWKLGNITKGKLRTIMSNCPESSNKMENIS